MADEEMCIIGPELRVGRHVTADWAFDVAPPQFAFFVSRHDRKVHATSSGRVDLLQQNGPEVLSENPLRSVHSVGEDIMGNLGDYQRMTTLAKCVGGPKVLGLAAAALGYIVLRPAEAGVKKTARAFKERGEPHPLKGRVFRVTTDGQDGGDVHLHEGDEYRVLEGDDDAILIEIVGGSDNPHIVAREFLKTVSDFGENKPD